MHPAAHGLLTLAQAIALLQSPAPATQDTPAAPPAAARTGAPVVLGRDTLFHFEAPLGAFSPAERAAGVRERLVRLARDPLGNAGAVRVVHGSESSDVVAGDVLLTTVTRADAAAAGVPRERLAQTRAIAVRNALEQQSVSTNYRTLALGALYTLIASLALYWVLRLLRGFFIRAQRLVYHWRGTRIRAVQVQKLQLVSGERLATLLSTALRLLRLALTVVVVYLYLALVFSFFPWTEGVADRLTDYIMAPLAAVFAAILDYLPHVFYLIVIIVAAAYALKLIHLVFTGIENGAVSIPGFYPDWAQPTYKLVRFLVIALAVVIAWPHLPRSDSAEFKGVAAFIGLLLSIGAASAVGNIVGGALLVYMRPFRVGDTVRIAETEGDVIERNLLVTRVRTRKNVEITIPNAMVLGSHIINYNAAAADGGVILHTSVTIGYDVPWRQVERLLLDAAAHTSLVEQQPPPFVNQTALGDFAVAYELNAFTLDATRMPAAYSELHRNIQDAFNEAGVEIMSPQYTAFRNGNGITLPLEYRRAEGGE